MEKTVMVVFKSVVMNTIVTVMLLSFSNVDLFKFLSNFHFPRIKNKIPLATYKKIVKNSNNSNLNPDLLEVSKQVE